jgi:DNA uptake protein ComE-like DNA-binding protein
LNPWFAHLLALAQNGAVLPQLRSVAAAAILCASFTTHAQYQDRDRSGAPSTSTHAPPPEARIDINRATVNELMKAPGLARPWAERIVRFRPYRTKQDLLDRGILSTEVYDRSKDFLIAHREHQ